MEDQQLTREAIEGDAAMRNAVKAFAPHSPIGWIAVALGFGVAAADLLLYFVSDAITNGGSESAPLWLHVLVPAAVLAVAILAVIVGFRSRRTDPSTLVPWAGPDVRGWPTGPGG